MCKDFILRVIFLYYHQLSMKINISMIMEKVNFFSVGFLCVCVCNSVCHVDVVVFCDVSLIFFFFNVCLGSLLYIYVLWLLWGLYYKCLINKTVLFLLKAFYLQLSIWFLSFSFPSCVFLLSQITDFYAVSLLPNRSSHSYSYCFLIFNL